jgi:hypothetical protein
MDDFGVCDGCVCENGLLSVPICVRCRVTEIATSAVAANTADETRQR